MSETGDMRPQNITTIIKDNELDYISIKSK